jgi:hypothetical protein
MTAANYRPVSFVPARRWENRAEEMLKDPDAFYEKARKERKAAAERARKASAARKWWILQPTRRSDKA